MENSIVVICVAVITGIAVGAGLAYLLLRSRSSNPGSVEQVEAKLADYQQQVETHFEKTSDLIDELTTSYKNVFDHLSTSAQSLLSEEQIQRQILNKNDRKVTLSYLNDTEETLATDKSDEGVKDDFDDEVQISDKPQY